MENTAAPAAVEPYAQAVIANGFVSTYGHLLIDVKTGIFPVKGQTRQVLGNVKSILTCAGISMNEVVKSTVLLEDMNDFGAINKVYMNFFARLLPCQLCCTGCNGGSRGRSLIIKKL